MKELTFALLTKAIEDGWPSNGVGTAAMIIIATSLTVFSLIHLCF